MDDNGPAPDDGPAQGGGPLPDSQLAHGSQSSPNGRAVILFDRACNLCNAMVRWAGRRDPNGRFRFVPLQSDEAARLLARVGATASDSGWARAGSSNVNNCADPGSIALVRGPKVHFRSGAVLRIALRLKFPYPLLAAGLLAPRPLRDAAYDWVARNRYRWFGRDATCPLPTTPPEPPNQGDSGGRPPD